MSKANVWMTNTKALYSTHKKATSKSASVGHGIYSLRCNSQDFIAQMNKSWFYFFPFYSHTRELVFLLFSISSQFFIWSYFFNFSICSHSYFPKHQIPDSPTWLCKGDRSTSKFSDQWYVLISSALVSLSCLIKQWPSPPSTCLLPIVPKCTSPYSPEEKKQTHAILRLLNNTGALTEAGLASTRPLLFFLSPLKLFWFPQFFR